MKRNHYLQLSSLPWLSYPSLLFCYPVVVAGLDEFLPLMGGADQQNYMATFLPLALVCACSAVAVAAPEAMSRALPLRAGPVWAPLLVFAAAHPLSAVANSSVGRANSVFAAWAFLVGTYFLIQNTFRIRSARLFVKGMVFATVSLSGLSVWSYLTENSALSGNPFAVFGTPVFEKNHAALLLETGFFGALAFAIFGRVRERSWSLAALLLIALGLLLARSRGAWIATVCSTVVILIYAQGGPLSVRRRTRVITFGVAAIACVLVLASPVLRTRVAQLDPRSSPARWAKLQAGMRALTAPAIFGVGPDNLNLAEQELLGTRRESAAFLARPGRAGVRGSGSEAPRAAPALGPASYYLRVKAELGWFGLLALAWLLWESGRILSSTVSAVRGLPTEPIVLALAGGLLANGIHYASIGRLLPFPWLHLFFALSVCVDARAYGLGSRGKLGAHRYPGST